MNRLLLACFGLLSAAPAFADYGEGNFYVTARGGALWVSNVDLGGGYKLTPDVGYAFTGALGYEFPLTDLGNPDHPIRLRTEIESGYGQSTATVAGVNLSADFVPVMANVLLDFYITEKWYVYGGIGGGLAITTLEVSGLGSASSTEYAVQARAGTGYKINETIALEVGYRIFSVRFEDPIGQMLEGGIVFRF